MSEILISLIIRSVLLVAFGGATVLLLWRQSAATKHTVWRLTVLGLLLMPALLFRLPSFNVSVKKVPQLSATIPVLDRPDRSPATLDVIHGERQPALIPATLPSAPVMGSQMDWAGVIPVIWVSASVISVLPLLMGLLSLVGVLRRGRRIELDGFSELCASMGIRKTVSLCSSNEISTPAAAGAFRPVVLLPAGMESSDCGCLQMVLRHELAHIRRGDWMSRIVARMCCSMYALNPLVWLVSGLLRIESETACDDLVLAGGVDPKAYAKELLAIARTVRGSNLMVATVGMAHRSKVEARLRAIVDVSRRRGPLSGKWLASLGAVCLFGVCMISAVRLVSAQAPGAKAQEDTPLGFPWQMQDDVPNHPSIPPILAGAKITSEPYTPPPGHVTIASNGVARLPNGITIKLEGIAPTATISPIWDAANREVSNVPMSKFRVGGLLGDSSHYVPCLDRSLFFTLDGPPRNNLSIMSYISSPKVPDHIVVSGVIYSADGYGIADNGFQLRPNMTETRQLLLAGSQTIHRATYRLGLAFGDWRTVMDVKNPFYSIKPDAVKPKVPGNAKFKILTSGGAIELNGVPCIIGPRGEGQKWQPNYRFAGDKSASPLVARRALLLDANGDVIRGERRDRVGWYPLGPEDIRRCTHFVVQEREYEWAEFRDIPLRPSIEANAINPSSAISRGTATGIAPGFVKSVPGIGTVSIGQVVSARLQGRRWTFDGQPRWRADGRVLAGLNSDPWPSIISDVSQGNSVTQFGLQYSGNNWHKVNSRIRINGDLTEQSHGVPGGLIADVRWAATKSFAPTAKEAEVEIDIADGLWQVLATRRVEIQPEVNAASGNGSAKTGLALLDMDDPKIVDLSSVASFDQLGHANGDSLPKPPTDTAHRFVVVLRNGSEQQVPSATLTIIPNRPGQDPLQERIDKLTGRTHYLASDVKEIRYEYRPITKSVRIEHVAVKPGP